ncbi:MAG: ATP synthase F1 subunit delta [Bacteroidales bacterium]|nr:ATP synthase F1 subunit delta [Bacteroidales bacterium]
MNTGIVSSRYAKALLMLVQESGRGEQVFAQVRELLARPESVPEPLEDDLARFVLLLRKNRRLDSLKLILHSFVRMYCKAEGIVIAHLTCAVPSPELQPRIEELLVRRTGARILMDTSIDASIIGGFILDIDDYRLDASVRRQLDDIRKELVQKNNRII